MDFQGTESQAEHSHRLRKNAHSRIWHKKRKQALDDDMDEAGSI